VPSVHKWAYDFGCNQSIKSILDAFNEAGPWQWQMRESVIFGDYLSCRPNDRVWVRVHEYSQMGGGPIPLFATEHFLASSRRPAGRLRDRRTPCGRRLRWRPQDSECERLEVLHDSGEMRGHWKVRWVGAWRRPDHTIQSP
jgi:hypothetical protein